MTVTALPEDVGPVFGITGVWVFVTGIEVGAGGAVAGVACGAQAASRVAHIRIVLKNNLLFIFSFF
jgi:hypothetical protein